MCRALLAILFFLPAGGGRVMIPLEETSPKKEAKFIELVRNIELDVYTCSCEMPEMPLSWQYDMCITCREPWKVSKEKGVLEASVKTGVVEITAREKLGCLYVLRRSLLQASAKEAGLTLFLTGHQSGPFAIHTNVDKAKMTTLLPALRGLEGIKKVEPAAKVVYINQISEETKVDVAALETVFGDNDVTIEDVSWALNIPFGDLGYFRHE